MIRPDLAKWEQSLADLRRLSIEAAHPRSRERFLALYMIGSGQMNATQWALHSERSDETVLRWVHVYNQAGPEALHYRHSGGRTPFLPRRRQKPSCVR